MINAGLALDLNLDVKGSFARQLREAADALHDMAEVLDPTGPALSDDEVTDWAYRNGYKDGRVEAADFAYRNGYRDGQREAAPSTEALSDEFKRGWDAGQTDMAQVGHMRFAPNPPEPANTRRDRASDIRATDAVITERTTTEYRADCDLCGWHGAWGRSRDIAEAWMRLHVKGQHSAPDEED